MDLVYRAVVVSETSTARRVICADLTGAQRSRSREFDRPDYSLSFIGQEADSERGNAGDPFMSGTNPCVAPKENSAARRVEWALGIVIALLLVVAAIPGVRPVALHDPAGIAMRELEELLLLARDEAIQTGDDHLVLFEAESGDTVFLDDRGAPAMASLFRDRDRNGQSSESEYVASVPAGLLRWGRSGATPPVNGEGVGGSASGAHGDAQSGDPLAVGGLIFRADGVPRSVSPRGKVAAGSDPGAVYLHTPTRDYAVVLSPWGDVDLQFWDSSIGAWQLARTP